MFQVDTSRTMTQILLSLFASARAVERMPVARVYGPREVVSIVRTFTENNRSGDYL